MIEVSSFKISVPIPSDILPRDILPPVGQPGSSRATVTLKLKSGEMELQAVVKAKSYRDVLAKVDASPHGAYVVLQGKLKDGQDIIEAGFAVQPIVPKESGAAKGLPSAPPSPAPQASAPPKRKTYVPLRSLHL